MAVPPQFGPVPPPFAPSGHIAAGVPRQFGPSPPQFAPPGHIAAGCASAVRPCASAVDPPGMSQTAASGSLHGTTVPAASGYRHGAAPYASSSAYETTLELASLVIRWERGQKLPDDAAVATMVTNVTGEYINCGMNCGRPMFRKVAGPSAYVALAYYVDDTPEWQGWWLGPEVNSLLFSCRNRSTCNSIPHSGWSRHEQPLIKLFAIPKMVDQADELHELHTKYQDLQQVHHTLEMEYDSLETKHKDLWTSYKNLVKDTKGGPAKMPRIVPPPGATMATDSAQGPEEETTDEPHPHSASSSATAPSGGTGQPRTRARTRGGLRVQAQRIVDLFVNGQYQELTHTEVPERLHY